MEGCDMKVQMPKGHGSHGSQTGQLHNLLCDIMTQRQYSPSPADLSSHPPHTGGPTSPVKRYFSIEVAPGTWWAVRGENARYLFSFSVDYDLSDEFA